MRGWGAAATTASVATTHAQLRVPVCGRRCAGARRRPHRHPARPPRRRLARRRGGGAAAGWRGWRHRRRRVRRRCRGCRRRPRRRRQQWGRQRGGGGNSGDGGAAVTRYSGVAVSLALPPAQRRRCPVAFCRSVSEHDSEAAAGHGRRARRPPGLRLPYARALRGHEGGGGGRHRRRGPLPPRSEGGRQVLPLCPPAATDARQRRRCGGCGR